MRALLALPLALFACKDETLSGYAPDSTTWVATELNGAPFTARATLTLPEEGRVEGQAPCNRYFAEQIAPYPWFRLGPIGATRMACPDLEAETAYLDALSRATLAEVGPGTLLLSDETGVILAFRAETP